MCHTDTLDIVKSVCRSAPKPMPLFAVDRISSDIAQFARSRASKISQRWNLWAEAIELKMDAIRPLDWIMDKNTSLQVRAVFSGGLRSSALACLQYDAPSGASEAELARLCRVTRKAMHEALDHLELCNMIRRSRAGRNEGCRPRPRSGGRTGGPRRRAHRTAHSLCRGFGHAQRIPRRFPR